jgi:uncharacterized protein (TIGR00730 family)
MSKIVKSVCVYCGSQTGNHPAFSEGARVLGKSLAEAGIGLVYGGGGSGIMGELARSVSAGGGKVTGIIPGFLIQKERGNGDGELGEMIVTPDMHERKTEMFRRSDAFIALPGGIGTLEEVVEMMTWAQLGRHDKPIVLANVDGFWDPLLDLLAHMAESGFIHTSAKLKPLVVRDAAMIVDALRNE